MDKSSDLSLWWVMPARQYARQSKKATAVAAYTAHLKVRCVSSSWIDKFGRRNSQTGDLTFLLLTLRIFSLLYSFIVKYLYSLKISVKFIGRGRERWVLKGKRRGCSWKMGSCRFSRYPLSASSWKIHHLLLALISG